VAREKRREVVEWAALSTDVRHYIVVDFELIGGDVRDRAAFARDALAEFERRRQDLLRGRFPEPGYRLRSDSPASSPAR
jgi:hypothetical protein